MSTTTLRSDAPHLARTIVDANRSRDPVFELGEDIRAREYDLIAPDVDGLVLLSWLAEAGTSGKIRAQEILDLCATEKHNGVIWTVRHYLKDHPTGNGKVDHLGHWDLFKALGIEVSVESLKAFLRHVVMTNQKSSEEELPSV